MRVNFPGFDDVSVFSSYTPPVGTYVVVVDGVPEINVEKEQLMVKLKIVAAKNLQNQADTEGKVFTDYLSMKKTAWWKTKALLVASGILAKDDTTSQVARGDWDTEILEGAKLSVGITHRQWVDQKDGQSKLKFDVEYKIGG